MNTLTFESDHKPTTLRWLKSISIAASLFIFANVASAGYSVLSGIPITQGQNATERTRFRNSQSRNAQRES